MKKQILNIGKELSRAEQKLVFGGDVLMNADDDGGPCRDAYPMQPAGCACQNNSHCKSGLTCVGAGGGNWWGRCA